MALLRDLRDMKALSPEQRVVINFMYSIIDGGATTITNVVPLYYEGVIAGSEFLTYAANKLYFCFASQFGCNDLSVIQSGIIDVYDENNVLSGRYTEQSILFDTVATVPNYMKNIIKINNYYFGRYIVARYNYMRFTGYRITYA